MSRIDFNFNPTTSQVDTAKYVDIEILGNKIENSAKPVIINGNVQYIAATVVGTNKIHTFVPPANSSKSFANGTEVNIKGEWGGRDQSNNNSVLTNSLRPLDD
jgi:hypothetical protein